jgi:hypothetical protein
VDEDNHEGSAADDLDDLVNDIVQSIEAGRDMRDAIHSVLKGALGEVERHETRRGEVEGTFRQFLLDVCSAAGMWKDVVTGEDILARLRELREREKALIDFVHSLPRSFAKYVPLPEEELERFEKIKFWAYPLDRSAESASVKESRE